MPDRNFQAEVRGDLIIVADRVMQFFAIYVLSRAGSDAAVANW